MAGELHQLQRNKMELENEVAELNLRLKNAQLDAARELLVFLQQISQEFFQQQLSQ